jgi:hypothetical protein
MELLAVMMPMKSYRFSLCKSALSPLVAGGQFSDSSSYGLN